MRVGFLRMKLHCFNGNFFSALPSLTPIQLPTPSEVHLWYVRPDEVKSESLLKQYLDILSPCEKENVLQMRGEELRKKAILARALVRTTIARYQTNSRINPRSLKFLKNIYGKPEVDWQCIDDRHLHPLHFNISHTSSLVACGIAISSQIGIDVEEKQRTLKHNILSFSRRYFSQHEVQFLAGISDTEVQRMEFIKLWTLKASEIGVEPTDLVSNWQFLLLELAGSHYAAICTERHCSAEGKRNVPLKLDVWKTIPFVEDEYVSGTDEVKIISGLR